MHNQNQEQYQNTAPDEQPPVSDAQDEAAEELKQRAERVEQLASDVSFGHSDDTVVKKTVPPPETRRIDPRDAPTPPHGINLTSAQRLGLRFEFDLEGSPAAMIEIEDELVIGRAGQGIDNPPDLDLTPFGGVAHGVSRQHLRIIKRTNTLHIMDLGSTNGTYLNGTLLFIGQPHVLRNGDLLRLGTLSMTVRIKPMQ